MIRIGTSGFSYSDWKGNFYPTNIPSGDMLAFYAREFSTCEINSTYYRILSPIQSAAMVRKAEGQVCFILKLHQSMTHDIKAGDIEFKAFAASILPFLEAEVLGSLLAQFPFAFYNSAAHRDYIVALKAKLGERVPLVVEFRHRSWGELGTLGFLESHDISVVNVDEPDLPGLMPPTDWVSGPVGYVRFHGRNKETWFKKNAQPWERYNYLYTESELREWKERIEKMAAHGKDVFVFFNNHWQSQAVTNAKQLGRILDLK